MAVTINAKGTSVSSFQIGKAGPTLSDNAGALEIRDGQILTLRDSTNADSVSFNHDGTDLNLTFVNTAELNITDVPIVIESATGDAAIYLRADTSNTVETSNPFIKFEQDGGGNRTIVGTVGSAGIDAEGNSVTNGTDNAFMIHHESGGLIDFAVQGAVNLALTTTANTSRLPFITVASTTSAAGLNVPHGTAPTAPVNGDLWTTSAGVFARVNGVTNQLDSGGGNVSNTGTPLDNQIAVWTAATVIEGTTGLTWDGTTLTTTGSVQLAGDLIVEAVQTKIRLQETGLGTDLGNSLFRQNGGDVGLYSATDAAPGTIVNGVWIATRGATTTWSNFAVNATTMTASGNVTLTGAASHILTVGDDDGGDNNAIIIGKGFDSVSRLSWMRSGAEDVSFQVNASENFVLAFDETNVLASEQTFVWSRHGTTQFRYITDATTPTFRFYDGGGTDYAELAHDGTDFNTTFVNTAAWNITGATGDMRVEGFAALRLRGGTDLIINTDDNATSSLIITPATTTAGATTFNATGRMDFVDQIRNTSGGISTGGSAANTGINEQVAFMDVNGGTARFGSYNWSLAAWQPVTFNGSTVTLAAQAGGITLTPSGTNNVQIGTMVFDADQSIGAGQDNYVLTYNNSSGLISLEVAGSGFAPARLTDSAALSTTGWYRIATNSAAAGQGAATFYISNAGGGSSPNPFMFRITKSYQATLLDGTITVLSSNSNLGESILGIRIIFDQAGNNEIHVEVNLSAPTSTTYTHEIETDPLGTWTSVDYTAGATADFDLTWDLATDNVLTGTKTGQGFANWLDHDGNLLMDGRDVASANSGIVIDARGDAFIDLLADRNSDTELENAYIRFTQDAGVVETVVGSIGGTSVDSRNNAFTNMPNNGFGIHHRFSSGTVGIGVNGELGFSVNDDNQAQLEAGTVSLPGLSFRVDPDTGVYRSGADALGLVVGGATRVAVTAAGATVTGTLAATTLTGAGSGITALTAANISAGNLVTGVLPFITATATSSAFKVLFANTTAGTSGNFALQMDTGAGPTYNPSTNVLTAVTFSGALSGNATTATTATGATNINISAITSTDTTTYPVLVGAAATGNQLPIIDNVNFSYNASTNTLTATNFVASGGDVTVGDDVILSTDGIVDWPLLEITATSDDAVIRCMGNGVGNDLFLLTHTTEDAVICRGGAEVELYHDAGEEFQTQQHEATGTTSGAGVKDHTDTYRDVGFNALPVFNDNASDILEAAHCGAVAFTDNSTGYTLTLEAAASLDFPVGGLTTVVNAFTSGDYTITEGASTTLYYLDGATRTDTTGGCTVGPGGVANIWREAAGVYYIWGTGITP